MKRSLLYRLTYVYLALPLLIFILSWLNAGIAVLFALLFALAFYKAFPQKAENSAICDNRCLLFLAALAVFWCFFAGIGYFYYQSFDYHFRNAVFRDLINYDWPVFYDKADTPLVYYMAFWLPAAVLAKTAALFIHNAQTLFYLGNIFLFVWSACGVVLIFVHLAHALKITETLKIMTAATLFILFSGLDVIGHAYFAIQEPPFEYHIEWWAAFIQYSSMTTNMFWVFNQFIPVALLTLLTYNERNIQSFGFLIALALFFAPYPTFSLGIFMVAYTARKFVQNTNKAAFISNKIFSFSNIVGIFWLLPLVIMYFITNSEGMDRWHYIFSYTTPARLLLFMLLEFLLYAAILFPQYCKNIFFQTTLALLIVIPFLRLDQQNNFCMRASIPALIMLCLFTLRFLFEKRRGRPLQTAILSCLLIIGSLTPLIEFYRGVHYTAIAGRMALVKDDIQTLNGRFIPMPEFGWDVNHQFTAQNYRTDIFWRYIAHIAKR